MKRPSERKTTAVERSRWLAELALAVDQALQLGRTTGIPHGNCAPAKELFRRLESVRLEIEALRRGGWGIRSEEIDPLWAKIFPNGSIDS